MEEEPEEEVKEEKKIEKMDLNALLGNKDVKKPSI